jgi:hypothetical protein
MEVKLVLSNANVRALKKNLGADRVTILKEEYDDFSYVSFELKNDLDVLHVIHAGQYRVLEAGLERQKEL